MEEDAGNGFVHYPFRPGMRPHFRFFLFYLSFSEDTRLLPLKKSFSGRSLFLFWDAFLPQNGERGQI
jgi:hypothetical protein